MSENLVLSGGKSEVTISGLSETDSITEAAFDVIYEGSYL